MGNCQSELASGSTCIPKCNNGFTLSGETSCSLGVLQESTCDPDPCDASKAPTNGKVGDCTSKLAVGTTCQPECDEGYSVSGVTSCVDGNLVAATCLELGGEACDASALPENAESAGDCTNSLAGGSTCSPVCKTGYTATPASCSNGKLTRATCVGTPCDASQAPTNGNIGSGATQCTNPMASGTQCQPGCDEGYDASGPTSCLNGVLTAATCVARACQDGETEYDGDCYPDVPAAQKTAFLDEYMELGSVTGRSTLSDAELTKIADTLKKFAAGGKNAGQYTVSFLYAPKTGGVAPDIPGTAVWTSGSLAIVARIELPSDKLSAASQALGSAFFSGDLLSELRAELGDDFSECTLLSKAFRQSYVENEANKIENKIDLFPARVSNQLVADEDNECLKNNGGCHPDVTCTPDPSRDPPVVCGACPAGFDGDGTVAGTGCQDVDECTDTALVNGGCSPLVTCTNTIGGRACGACPAGYTGDGTTCDDIDECAKNNGGCDRRTTCTNIDGGRECGACPSGYKGSGETKCVRESGCSVKNGGCDKLVTCTDDGNGGSICGPCPAGYDGDGTSGCVDHDACVNNPCAAGVHCKDDKPPLMTRSCGKCPAGQVGDGETCVGNPCFVKNGGCDPLRSCTVDESSGAAVCGDCPSGYELSGGACVNKDGCANTPCYAGVLCTDLAPPRDGYKCGKCPPGYTGDGETCEDEDECEKNNGGCDKLTSCTNNVGGPPTCGACPTGYKGSGTTGCKKAESACSKNNGGCDPAASCQEGANGIVCGPCPPTGYEPGGTGDTGCVDIDGCASNPCYAGVTCEDVPAPGVGHTCGACPEGFRGDGTTCTLCDMSVWIAASTMVNGAMARGKDTRIVAAAQLMDAACTNEEGYQFQWSASRSDGEEVVLDPKRTKSDTMQLFLPKKSLPPGVSYTLRFEGRQASNPKVSSSAEFDFFVEAAPLEAIIVGGDVLLSEGVSFTLDATSSIDPDDDDEYEWEYTWQCEAVAPTAGDCLDPNGESIDLPRASADKLENLELAGAAGPAGQTYTFTLAASRGPRRAETTTEVAVISAAAGATGAPPVVSIAPFPGGKVNSGEYARIKSTVVSEASADSLAMLWSATRVPDGGGSTETVDLLSGNFISSSSITGAFLVLSPNVLETGYRYKFKLAVEDSNGEAAAFITLAENTPPYGGSVIAVPATGTALSTKFRLAASAWTDTDAPLAYRFTAQIKGEENVRQLQDFGPRSEYEGTLPGGLASESNVVIVGVQVRDSLGAVSVIAETEVISAWPVLATEAAATEATTAAVAAAEEAFKSGGGEAAINQISAACLQLENFKQQQSRRRLLAANGCIGGGGVNATGAAAARAAEREKMLDITRNAGEMIPASATLFAAMAGTAAQILADPCESTSAARASGVSVIANLVNVTSSADNDLTLDADGSLNMLSALSAAVTPVEANDTNAASAAEAATQAAMRVMKTQLGPAVPGEKPAAVNTTMMSYVAQRMATRGNATAASTSSAAGASFSVPGEALALSGTDPVDQLLLAMAYDAHAASAPINATAAAEGDVSAAPRAAGTVSLTLSNSSSGDELAVRNLAVPIAFELELNDGGADIGEDTCFAIDFARQLAAQSATPETEAENATDATLPPPKERAVCSFWDEDLLEYSSEGCATLPNPKFPGGTLAWAPGVQNGTVPLRAEDEVFLWVFAHPTALEGCEMEEVLASDNATRMRVYNQLNGSATNCTIEDPENEQRCHWRRDAQAFEGCGCETTPRVSCLCNHATDFTASASPPKVKTISIEELLSVSLDDLLNTWKVFAVVGGMFGCMMILVVMFEIRDRRARRKLLNKFIDGPSSEAMAFSVVSDVWTWSIDVQEMQFMFNNLHHPNTAEAVAEVLKERFGDDDARVERELKAIIESKEDYCAMDVDRAVERRKKALLRAARAKEGLPQVPGMREDERDDDDVDVSVVRQIEHEIEKNVETADVGIRVTKENGKTRFESTLSSGNVLSHENKLAMGLEDGEEEEDFDAEEKKAALARLGSKARRKRLRKLTHRSTKYVPPPREMDVSRLPVVKRNGPKFCANVGLKYVRFLIAFPIESLNRNLIMWKNANDKRGVFLPFDRAVGTAMVYAHLDMNNIVGHVEMASRIYDAAQLPWLMPTGVTFPLLVAEFKAMLSGNITGSGWMKRSTLWNIVSLQNPDGHWNASDSLAGALRAAGPPELSPPIDKVNANPIIKSFYGAEEMLRECPPRLRACARRMGHNTIDSIWCSLLAMEGCKQAGLNWVLNPWDNLFFEFDIVQCGWTWIELRVNCDAEIAAAVMEAETHAEVCVTRWREHFTDTVRGLHAMRMQEEKERLKKQAAKAGGVPAKITKFVCGALLSPVKAIKSFFAWLYGFVMWAIKLYMAAHMFFRVFLANPTDAFSAAERTVMQCTMYLTSLLLTVWFYYNKATECCVIFRQDIGCSSDPLDECQYVPAGAGCAVLMGQADLKPPGWTCTAFPDKKNGWHFLTVVSIQIVIMFPVKFILTKTFTEGGGSLTEPHWRQAVVAAGMNLMEVYVAWLECLYQAIEDPIGVFRKPEIAAIIARFAAAAKKTIMVTLMQQAMTFVAAFMWGLDKLGIYKKKKARERRFQDTDVIRGNIRSIAMSDATFALKLADVPENSGPGDAGARKGASVESRRLFTKGTVTGTVAAVGVHGVDVPTAKDPASSAAEAEADAEVGVVVGVPAELLPELHHMASLHAVYGGVRPRVKGTGGRDSPTSIHDAGADVGSGASSESGLSDDEAADDLDARARDAAATAASLVSRVAERAKAYATIGDAVDAATSLCDLMDAVVSEAENAEDGARAFALVRSAAHEAGAVTAATAMMRLPQDSPRAGDVALRVEMRSQCAGAAMLARVCLDNPEALLEFRIEDGFAVVEAMLARVDPAPTARAEADAAAVVSAAVNDSGRAARRAIAAGLVRRVRKRFHAASLACYESSSALARLQGDRDERDRVVALAAAFAAMKSREREHERDPNATWFDVAEFYVDVARVMPPNVDCQSKHVGPAAAALAAMLRAFPGTADDAEEAMRRAAVIPALTGMTLGTSGYKAHATLAEAFGADAMHRMGKDTSGGDPGGTVLPPLAASASGDAAEKGGSKTLGSKDGGWVAKMKSRAGAALAAADDAAESVEMRALKASKTVKEMVAMQTISLEELKAKRKQYLKKLKWSTLFMANVGWFLSMFVWFFGGYVIITYGVLIYRYLGPGEESTYITTWGMAFLINNFGLESMKIIGRKAFFIFIITNVQKTFMKAAEALGWYEVYTEMVGMHLLAETGAYDSSAYRADDEDDGGDDDDGGDGGGDGD